MPTFAQRDPTSSKNEDLLRYLQELVFNLRYTFANLDEENIPKLKDLLKSITESKPEDNDGKMTVQLVLSAYDWTDGLYYIDNEAIKEDSVILIAPRVGAMDEEITAYASASLYGARQSDGSITLKAYGKVPTIDISIDMIIL